MMSLRRKKALREEARRVRDAARKAERVSRTGQVARSTVETAEGDVPVADALTGGAEAIEATDSLLEDVDVLDYGLGLDDLDQYQDAEDATHDAQSQSIETAIEMGQDIADAIHTIDETRTELDGRLSNAEATLDAADGRIKAAEERADAAFGASNASTTLAGELLANPSWIYGPDGFEEWDGSGGRVVESEGGKLLLVGSDGSTPFAETMTRETSYFVASAGSTYELRTAGFSPNTNSCKVQLLDSGSLVLAEIDYVGLAPMSVRWKNEGADRLVRVRVSISTDGSFATMLRYVSARDVTSIANAEDAADAALTMAGTRTRVYYSTSAPSGSATENDIWRRQANSAEIAAGASAGDIMQEWRYTGTGWEETKVSSTAIANLDVGKLTAGSGVISDLVANHIAGRTAQFMDLDVARLVATDATLREAVIEKIWSDVVKAKFLTVTEKIITKDVIATGAIDGTTVRGVHIIGGEIEQVYESTPGWHAEPMVQGGPSYWETYEWQTDFPAEAPPGGGSDHSIRPWGGNATFRIPDRYYGDTVRVRFWMRAPVAGTAEVGHPSMTGYVYTALPANTWVLVNASNPIVVEPGRSRDIGVYVPGNGLISEPQIEVITAGMRGSRLAVENGEPGLYFTVNGQPATHVTPHEVTVQRYTAPLPQQGLLPARRRALLDAQGMHFTHEMLQDGEWVEGSQDEVTDISSDGTLALYGRGGIYAMSDLKFVEDTYGWDTNPGTVASGWSLITAYARRWGPLVSVSITVERTGAAINVGTSGNIANQVIFNMNSEYISGSPMSQALTSGSTGRVATGAMNAGGSVSLAAVGGSSNVATGEQINLSGIYFIG